MQTINLGGEDRPFRCSWKQLKKLARKKKLTKLQDLGSAIAELELDDITWFLHTCLKDASEVEGDTFAYTLEDVDGWIDEQGFPAITDFLEKVSASLTGEKLAQGNPTEPEPEAL